MTRLAVRCAFVVVAVIAALGATACSTDEPEIEHPAAQAIDELLELRRDDVRDPQAYAPYFLESALATALADGSDEPTGTPRVPRWKTPYVSEETSVSASVVVVWEPDDDFEGWPAVNIFEMSLREDRWVVVDAIEATSAPEPIGSRSEK